MRLKTVAIVIVFLACASVSKADITNWNCAPDTDGVMSLNSPNLWTETAPAEYELTMDATQNEWNLGHMIGWFYSPDGDPTIKFTNSIDNDTGGTWTDYHINIYMDNPFTIVPGSAFVNIPSDWSVNSIITPVAGAGYYDDHSTFHQYKGSIDYYAGTPVPDLGSLEFGYKVNYNLVGTINFTQEMYPTPEPGTLVLLACGLLGIMFMRRRFA